MIEMIVSDMDGTLLNRDGEISQANIDAIKTAQANNILFAIASGRAQTEALPILQKAGIKCPIITGNGAQGFDSECNVLFTYDIHKDTTQKIIDLLDKANVYYEIATTNGVYSTDANQRLEQAKHHVKSIQPHLSDAETKALAAAHLDKLKVTFIDSFAQILTNPEIQILKFIVISEKGQKVLQPLGDKIAETGEVQITSSFENNIEINAREATKGEAVKTLADYYHKDLQNTLVLGDNYNDISMFNIAGYSAAMENAVPELKAIATYVSTAHHLDGVAKAIHHFIK